MQGVAYQLAYLRNLPLIVTTTRSPFGFFSLSTSIEKSMALIVITSYSIHYTKLYEGPIRQRGASASAVILGQGESTNLRFDGIAAALAEPDTQLRLFGKPEISGGRRLGVALARAESIDAAVEKAKRA